MLIHNLSGFPNINQSIERLLPSLCIFLSGILCIAQKKSTITQIKDTDSMLLLCWPDIVWHRPTKIQHRLIACTCHDKTGIIEAHIDRYNTRYDQAPAAALA